MEHVITVCRPQYIVAYGEVLQNVQETIEVAKTELRDRDMNWRGPVLFTIATKDVALPVVHIPDDFLSLLVLPVPHC